VFEKKYSTEVRVTCIFSRISILRGLARLRCLLKIAQIDLDVDAQDERKLFELFHTHIFKSKSKSTRFFGLASSVPPYPHYLGKLDPDPYYGGKLVLDPHQNEKQVPDPHQSEKQDPDPGPDLNQSDPQHCCKPFQNRSSSFWTVLPSGFLCVLYVLFKLKLPGFNPAFHSWPSVSKLRTFFRRGSVRFSRPFISLISFVTS
jgi:hypothetical protein